MNPGLCIFNHNYYTFMSNECKVLFVDTRLSSSNCCSDCAPAASTPICCICCNAIWMDVEIKITYVCEDNVLIESVSVSCTGWDGKPQNNREGPETGGGLWVPPTPLCQRNPVQTSKWLAWMHTLHGTYCAAHIRPAIWPFFKHGLGYGTFVPSVSC